jgi:GT2 family glycosyltransferase
MKYPISVVIPVYKNYEMFYKYLNINKRFLEGCEVIVMNDYPQENITKNVTNILPTARVFNNRKNRGFAGNVNLGVSKSERQYVMLMNSDVVLKDNSFVSALDHFKKERKLFAVSFKQEEKDGKTVGANAGYFANGMINHRSRLAKTLSPNFWAEGGTAIFKKKLFVEMGMLDELYNPFYWEDIDLSYRAWKAGYKILFDPQIVVEHHHESTIGKYFDKKKVLKTAFRNQLIFQWKNLTDANLMASHILNLTRLFFSSLLRGDDVFLNGFFRALFMLPAILQSRKKSVKLNVLKDSQVLELFQK